MDTISRTALQIRPAIFGSNLTKIDQSILGVWSVMHDAGTNNAESTITDPIDTHMKELVTSDPVAHGRGRVLLHFSANPTIDFCWIGSVKKWSIDP